MENSSDILQVFGNRVRELRINKGFTQESLANSCGLHRTYIGMIERGEKNITLSNIKKISDALDLSISDLMDIKDGLGKSR